MDIDCKTLHMLEDHLNQEFLLYKKCLNYGEKIYDSELKNICYNASQKHKENYQSILSYLHS
ncbi:hypothetical protein [Brassicibacter mesophilus]|uniref:hypothetical protein n=1 Tax=Brassicibacter mesophilus TaxID=745119 RepID=UPI003D2145E3